MSKGEPFKFMPLASLLFNWEWRDAGTGGSDWGVISATNVPKGYASLGDYIYKGGLPLIDNTIQIDPARAWNVQGMFVNADRPDVAKPCTGYELVGTLSGNHRSNIWRPVHTDPDYVSVGHVVKRNAPETPYIGKYYCLHRRYLINIGYGATNFLNDDGARIFRTIDGTNIFRHGDGSLYKLRDDADLQSCCTGSGSDCQSFTKGSLECQRAMVAFCSIDDIKPGGKCEDWCAKDPENCDKGKKAYCVQNPQDPFCDCINAFDRPDHAAFIKNKETIYGMSIPACYYSKCKLGPYKVFTTTEMVQAQQGQRCSQDLKYIDQQIKVLGDNNVLDTDQNAGMDDPSKQGNGSGGGSVGTPVHETIVGLAPNVFWVIIAVLFGIVVYFIGKGRGGNGAYENRNQGLMQYAPMPQYQQYQPQYAPMQQYSQQ